MADIPAVSVVIPLYNKGPYIARALNSVFVQTRQEFEIIVVEGGSTDQGPDVINDIKDPRLRLVQQEGKGVSTARNQGIKEAKADFITFLDADDEWCPTHLETLLRLKAQYPQAGAYASSYIRRLQNGHIAIDIPFANSKVPPPPWEGLIHNYFHVATFGDEPLLTSVVGVPKEIFDIVGPFPVNEWWGEDTDMWGRVALKFPIAFSRSIGAIYHTEATNRASKKPVYVKEHPFVKTIKRTIQEGYDITKLAGLEEYLARKILQTVDHNLTAGHNRMTREQLKECHTKVLYKRKLLYWILSFLPQRIYRESRYFYEQIVVRYLYSTNREI